MTRSALTLQTIDLHCGGEPLRLITAGYPPIPIAPVLERRRWIREHADHVRRAVVYEPRGHRDMYAAVLLPPGRPDADLTVLFMHNEGYSTMCGHGTIAIATALVQEGLFPAEVPETVIRLEAPAGLVTAHVMTHRRGDGAADSGASTVQGPAPRAVEDSGMRAVEGSGVRAVEVSGLGAVEVSGVRFENVPSYLAAREIAVRPDGLGLDGPLSVDIGFGGAYYGIVDVAALGLRVVPAQVEALTRAGAAITEVLRRDHTPEHPTDPELGFVYGTILVDHDPATSPDGRGGGADIRNVTVFAEAEVDRSPCGSGTSALLAQGAARGDLRPGDELANASVTGAVFRGRLEGETRLGSWQAWTTTVAGMAYVTGYSTLVVDDRDPLGGGFLLR